jgi:hypothetical protein
VESTGPLLLDSIHVGIRNTDQILNIDGLRRLELSDSGAPRKIGVTHGEIGLGKRSPKPAERHSKFRLCRECTEHAKFVAAKPPDYVGIAETL